MNIAFNCLNIYVTNTKQGFEINIKYINMLLDIPSFMIVFLFCHIVYFNIENC